MDDHCFERNREGSFLNYTGQIIDFKSSYDYQQEWNIELKVRRGESVTLSSLEEDDLQEVRRVLQAPKSVSNHYMITLLFCILDPKGNDFNCEYRELSRDCAKEETLEGSKLRRVAEMSNTNIEDEVIHSKFILVTF